MKGLHEKRPDMLLHNYFNNPVFQLVCQSVDYKVAQLIVTSQEDDSILQSLISVHQAYQMLAPRLKYFRAMNAVWPECSSRIMDLKQADPKNEMFTEEEFVSDYFNPIS